MQEENEAIIRRLIEEAWNQRKLSVIDELLTPDFVSHDPTAPETGPGPEGYKVHLLNFYGGLPEERFTVKFTVDEMISAGDRVVTRWTARGGPKANPGVVVTVTGIEISRLSGGKLAETWAEWNMLGYLQQIGVVPPLHPRESYRNGQRVVAADAALN